MRVVLFGAGASFGSGDVKPRVPPLGGQLFPVLKRLYTTWRSIPHREAGLFARHFEEGMAAVITDYNMAVAPLMQELAMFFSIFRVGNFKDNRYASLLSSVTDPQNVLWSTLNYECLFEHAASLLGNGIDYFGEPAMAAKAVPLWKLHGSCNFRVVGLEAGRGVQFGTGVVFGGEIEALDPSQVFPHYAGNTALYPAMALYAASKPISMSPRPILDAQARWARAVRASKVIVIVGVHPNPDDTHVWDPIADTSGEVFFVGAEDAFIAWRDSHRGSAPTRFLAPTWSECSDQIVEVLYANAGAQTHI